MKAETTSEFDNPNQLSSRTNFVRDNDEDSRPVITCDCTFWGTPCPHFLWPEKGSEDAIHAAAAAAVTFVMR